MSYVTRHIKSLINAATPTHSKQCEIPCFISQFTKHTSNRPYHDD